MMKIFVSVLLMIAASSLFIFAPARAVVTSDAAKRHAHAADTSDDVVYKGDKVIKTKAQWKRILPRETYIVTREAGTERPYSHPLLKNKRKGIYHCASCNLPLFSSANKYDSRTGWASFYQPIAAANVTEKEDRSNEMEVRTEILCSRCNAHLGHVFKDGPEPTGLRYCMNGVALKFVPATRTVARRR